MAFLPWFNNKIASPIFRGGQWLGNKVIQPGLSWLKAHDAQLSPVIQAAEPLLDTVGKAWNAGAEAVEQNKRISMGQLPESKRRKIQGLSTDDLYQAGQSALKTRQAVAAAGGARSLADGTRSRLKSSMMHA